MAGDTNLPLGLKKAAAIGLKEKEPSFFERLPVKGGQ